jgi:hypothetical protein
LFTALELFRENAMIRNPILDLPLSQVMRPEIALSLQDVLKIYTVGNLLKAWRNPRLHRTIEQMFDCPADARNAVAICSTWLGVRTLATHKPVDGWWRSDDFPSIQA